MTGRRLLLLTLVILAGCGGHDGPTPPDDSAVTSVRFAAEQDTVLVGASLPLSVEIRDVAGNLITDRSASFESLDPTIVTVSGNSASSIAIGTAAVVASLEEKSDTLMVVAAPVVSVGRDLPVVLAGDTTALTATLSDVAGAPLTGPAPEWSSSDEAIARVSAIGVVTGVSPGFATITAKVSGGQGTQVVAVTSGAPRSNREIGFLRYVQPPDGTFRKELRTISWSGGPAASISVLYNEVSEFEWSPSGDQIAVNYIQVNGEGKSGLYLVPAAGGVEQLIASLVFDPHWSPDGSRILVRRYIANGESDIYSVRPDGTDLRRLTTQPGDELEPQWSPDGRQFLYYRSGGFGPLPGELWVARADGSRARKLDVPTSAGHARWAPDAKRIAYNDANAIWVINADGSGAHAISPNCAANVCSGPALYAYPAWSPDGQRLAYGGAPVGFGGAYRVYISRPDGSALVEVPAGLLEMARPTWSPDVVHLTFNGTLTEGGWPAVFVVNADGSDRVALTGPENTFAPEWRP